MHLTLDRITKANEVLDAVVDYYGPSEYHDFTPELVCFHDPADHWGYCDDKIYVNFARCRWWRDVVQTIIHEYTHHLQDPERRDEESYELECAEAEMRDFRRFLEL